MNDLAPHISNFLRQHLPQQRNASHHTIASYADSFMLFVSFAADQLCIRPCALTLEHLTTALIFDFLDHLETNRKNMISTRNVRLAAVKSLFRYLEYRLPACLDLAQQVRAIPMKMPHETVVDSLDHDEIQALLNAPDPQTVAGVRDRAMLHLAYTAGLRVSELVNVLIGDFGHPSRDSVRITGKGRRERVLPLWKETGRAIQDWLVIRPAVRDDHAFLNARGVAMSRHGFAHRLSLHAMTASKSVPSIADKHVTPHVMRHSCALSILEATGDIRKVSLWLGHASLQSTEIYLRNDPLGKLDVLAARIPPEIRKGTFNEAPDKLMEALIDVRTQYSNVK